jgi:hypothetical protein
MSILRKIIMQNSRGNVFVIIVGILAVIFTMATYFMQTTIEEKHQTERSNRVIQTQCVAEAGLELALGYVTKELNKPENWKDEHSIARKLRLPLRKLDKKLEGMQENLGTDFLLDIADVNQPMFLTRRELDNDGGPQLDELFRFMVSDDPKAKYELEVKVKVEKAITNLPGPSVDGTNYRIPGIDMEWECHSGVRDFLDNKGYEAITMRLPDGLTWLKFEIPVEVMGVEIFSFDIIDILKTVVGSNGGMISDLLDKTDLNNLLTWMFRDTGLYPYTISFARNVFPSLSEKLGGYPIPMSLDDTQAVEKSGFLAFESKASVTYTDGRTITKTVFASKEFKCADVEPVSPLYSFFISNLNDDRIMFNNLGGNLYVNNFAGFGAIKGDPAEPERREYPGLIRVNGTSRMDVNLSVMGNPVGPSLYQDDNFAKKLARGCEWLLMADVGFEMKSFNANTGLSVDVKEKTVNSIAARLPSKLQGVADRGVESLRETKNAPADKQDSRSKGPLGGLVSLRLNIMPPTSFGVKIWEAPLHFVTNKMWGFGRWEIPYCGNSWDQFTLPLPFFSTSVTHFFGSCGIFPTMTRDIEGFVTKRYRQWNLGVVSYPMGPMPLGNQIPTPWGIMLLPVPLPMWHTHTIANKYEYNFYTFKTADSKASPGEVRVYDPGLMQNSPPNLYSIEQYAKKANFYYATYQDFLNDLENRITQVNGKDCFKLEGITFVRDSMTLPPVNHPKFPGSFYVSGRGAIVCGGNVTLNGNIEDPFSDSEERNKDNPRTVFSLIVRSGGVLIGPSSPAFNRFEGSLYTDKCIGISPNKSLFISGNWVTNSFSKAITRGEIMVEYVAYKTRSSLGSVHPIQGKFDPERYYVSLAPVWETWRIQ